MFPGGIPEAYIPDVKAALGRLMTSECPKFVQSVQMEVCWTRELIGVEPTNVVWDTLIASHIEDSRDFYTGLKFQAYIKYGIMDYSSEIDKYFTGGHWPINRLNEAPLDRILTYNAVDAKVTRWLAIEQQQTIPAGTRYRGAYDLFHQGVFTMTNLERRGIPIKPDVFAESKQMLDKRILRLDDILDTAPEVLQFIEKFNRKPDLMSSLDLKSLVYDIMQVPINKTTKTGQAALDEEVFDSINTDFTNMVVRKRKAKKILDYLKLFLKLNDSGYLHPAFWLNSVRTYRSSSSDPNFQNIPKRSEEALRILRSGIVPRPGA
jgi:DNA polymerase I-like protein with 3'-5' exonuclease and polymerase domains